MSSVLVLETHDPHEEDFCFSTRMAERISRDQVGSTIVRPIVWDPAPAGDICFNLEGIVRHDRAVPDDASLTDLRKVQVQDGGRADLPSA
jgi:hypothetical protein